MARIAIVTQMIRVRVVLIFCECMRILVYPRSVCVQIDVENAWK